jgi:hypothetical protein
VKRFWVMGPVMVDRTIAKWGVVDGWDLPGQRPASKPTGYQEYWFTQGAAQAHADELNSTN